MLFYGTLTNMIETYFSAKFVRVSLTGFDGRESGRIRFHLEGDLIDTFVQQCEENWNTVGIIYTLAN